MVRGKFKAFLELSQAKRSKAAFALGNTREINRMHEHEATTVAFLISLTFNLIKIKEGHARANNTRHYNL